MAEEKEGKRPKSKSKHNNVQIHKKYKDGKLSGRWCPRCGSGVILAQHKNRETCGKCGYSEFKNK
jgi:ubiquitin-small subunit ribosomal protein S27Ae